MKWLWIIILTIAQPLMTASAETFEDCLDECTDGWATCEDGCVDIACVGKCATKKNDCEKKCKSTHTKASFIERNNLLSTKTHDYAFTYEHPPLVNVNYTTNVHEMSDEQLGKTLGSASWTEIKEERISSGIYEWKKSDIKIDVTRRAQWKFEAEFYSAVDTPHEIVSSQGYEKEKSETSERTITQTFSASGGYKGLLEVTGRYEDQLKLTAYSKENWNESTIKKVNMTLKGGKKYYQWKLLDVLDYTFTINEKILLGTQKNLAKEFPTRIEKAQIQAVVSPYWIDEGDVRVEFQKQNPNQSSMLMEKNNN